MLANVTWTSEVEVAIIKMWDSVFGSNNQHQSIPLETSRSVSPYISY